MLDITSSQLKIINYISMLADGYNDETFQSFMSEYPSIERTTVLDNVYITLLKYYYSNRKDAIVIFCNKFADSFYNGKLFVHNLSYECITSI